MTKPRKQAPAPGSRAERPHLRMDAARAPAPGPVRGGRFPWRGFSHRWEETERDRATPSEPRFEVREVAKGFEASFSLSLTAARPAQDGDAWVLPPPTLQRGCSLDVVHRLEGGVFSCLVRGRAVADRDDWARGAVRALWRDLGVSLGDDRAPYAFSPVTSPRNPSGGTDSWCVDLRPAGLRVDTRSRRLPGFTARSGTRAGTLLLDAPRGQWSSFLDALAGLSGTDGSLRLTLSLEPFELDSGQDALIEEALRHLLGEGDAHYASGRPVRDEELLAYVVGVLESWRRDPRGFRLRCVVEANRPVSNALLGAIGEQLCRGDRPTWSQTGAGYDSPASASSLDLRGTFPRRQILPPLLPSGSLLTARGMPTLHVRVPDALPERGLRLGDAGPQGRSRPVFLPEEDRKRHVFVLGATGTGKSTFIQHMVLQDVAAGAGLCLLDPHGDLYDAVLDTIPHRLDDVILIEAGDAGRAAGVNLLETSGTGEEGRQTASFISNEIISILDRLYDLRETGGPMFELYMRNTLLLIMENRIEGGTLLDVPLVFEDSDYRAKLLEGCTNPAVVSFWRKQAERAGGEASLVNITPYVTSKLNQFTHNTLLRPIVGQARSTVDFRSCMDEGKILLVKLSKGLLGELSSRLLGMLVLGKLFKAAMGRARIPAAERRPFHIYVDEAQEFTTSTAANMMAEARKFGLHLTLATQTLAQVSEGREAELGKMLLGNAGSLLLFRLGAPDAGKMASYTAPELSARDLEDLPNFHVAARLLAHGRPTRPFVFRTPPPGPPASPEELRDRRERLLEVRNVHARHVSEVEKALERRREELGG